MEVVPLDVREMFDTLGSFIAGLGKKDRTDINNAVFIGEELLGLALSLEFRDAGRLGVASLELYGILEDIKPSMENSKAYESGKTLSKYDSRELMLMASYLWNKGRSSLDKNEREEALALLQQEFGITEGEQVTQPSTAVASG